MTEKFSACYNSLCESALWTLRGFADADRAYQAVFPASLSRGLFSTQAVSPKAVTTAYYTYAAETCRIVDRLELDVQGICRLMQDADGETDAVTVLRCDEWLRRYGQLKEGLSSGLAQSELLLRRESEALPLSDLFRYGQQMRTAMEQFGAFLAQELQGAPKSV